MTSLAYVANSKETVCKYYLPFKFLCLSFYILRVKEWGPNQLHHPGPEDKEKETGLNRVKILGTIKFMQIESLKQH